MKKSDITTAIKARLATGLTTIPGAWPNVGYNGTLPYFDLAFPGVNRRGNLAGGFRVETGTIAVIVAVAVDTGTDAADGFAQAVADLFPGAYQFPVKTSLGITTGKITITGQPNIVDGYRAGSEWRVPVMIPFTATTA